MQDPKQGGPIVVKPIPHQVGASKQITWLDGDGNAVSREEAMASVEEPALEIELDFPSQLCSPAAVKRI